MIFVGEINTKSMLNFTTIQILWGVNKGHDRASESGYQQGLHEGSQRSAHLLALSSSPYHSEPCHDRIFYRFGEHMKLRNAAGLFTSIKRSARLRQKHLSTW